MAAPAWTPTEYGKVATMLQRGASAGEIGNAMKISRNAATGRIMRDPFLAELWHRHHRGKGGSHPNNIAKATSPRLADLAPRHPPQPKRAPAAKQEHAAAGEPMRYFREVVLCFGGEKCLDWPFAKNGPGYGKLWINGKLEHVHRLACEAVHGPPPSAQHYAVHLCGNGHLGCCNPRHIMWATPKENQAHRLLHGTDSRGEKNWAAILSPEQVHEIRGLKGKETKNETARRFGVSRSCVDNIQRGARWNWLEWEPGWEAREAEATQKPPGIPLVELGLCQCHWPIAEDHSAIGKHLFCGIAIAPGEMYCEPHRRKAVA
jgi:hypothetical protein